MNASVSFGLRDLAELSKILCLEERSAQLIAGGQQFKDGDPPEVAATTTDMAGSDRCRSAVFIDLLFDRRWDEWLIQQRDTPRRDAKLLQ